MSPAPVAVSMDSILVVRLLTYASAAPHCLIVMTIEPLVNCYPDESYFAISNLNFWARSENEWSKLEWLNRRDHVHDGRNTGGNHQ
jgi:hypothetical protein